MSMGVLYGLAVALIWGAQPVVATFGYRAGLNAFDLTMLRFGASGLIMLPFVLKRGMWDACGVGWRRIIILTLLAGPTYNLVLIGGLHWAPASHSSLIFPACTPVFTALLARFVLKGKERIPVLGLALLVAGVIVVKLGALLQPGVVVADVWRGDLLFIAAAVMWSTYTILMRRWNTNPLSVVAMIQVIGLAYLPVYFLFQGAAVLQVSFGAIALQTLYLGVVSSIVSVLLFNLAVRDMGPKASMFTALMPVVGVGTAVWLLDERLTLGVIGGTVLIAAGLFFSFKGAAGSRK
jgi:drug/metabolite transporter (DMT)-like permease